LIDLQGASQFDRVPTNSLGGLLVRADGGLARRVRSPSGWTKAFFNGRWLFAARTARTLTVGVHAKKERFLQERFMRLINTTDRLWRGGLSLLVAALLLSPVGCAANKQTADASFLKEVEKDPFPSASSKGLAVK
jgi:hypothetical protein